MSVIQAVCYTAFTLRSWNSRMRLTDILQPVCVKVPLESGDKTGVITELVDLLAANGPGELGSGPHRPNPRFGRSLLAPGLGPGAAPP